MWHAFTRYRTTRVKDGKKYEILVADDGGWVYLYVSHAPTHWFRSFFPPTVVYMKQFSTIAEAISGADEIVSQFPAHPLFNE